MFVVVAHTEEEITAMQAELDKYGIQMPAFGKIGGILANELSVDEAAVHAAVLAINAAIDQDDTAELMKKLQLPEAGLMQLEDTNAAEYHKVLRERKEAKIAQAEGKSEVGKSSKPPFAVFAVLATALDQAGEMVAVLSALVFP